MASQLVPILTNEATAARRQVYFDLRDATDGITAETGEAGGQPQISTNGGAFTNTGIGTLTSIGSGEYFAEVTQAATNITAGGRIKTRYKSAATAESRGDTLLIMGRDPFLAVIDANVTAMAAGVITATVVATDAIDADAIADNAINAGAIATGAITAAKFAAGAIDAAAIANGAIDAATFAAGAIDAAAIANGAIDAATFAAGAIDAAALAADAGTEIAAAVDTTLTAAHGAGAWGGGGSGAIVTGTADSGASVVMVDAARTEADTDYWKGCWIHFTSGNIAGQVRLIISFNPASDEIQFTPATTQDVSTGITYEILPAAWIEASSDLGTNAINQIGAEVANQGPNLADDFLDADVLTHSTPDSVGWMLNFVDNIAATVDEILAIDSGTPDSGTTTTIVDAARTEADSDYWKGCWVQFTTGNISGQVRLITGFNAATDTITFAPATTQSVTTFTNYRILPAAGVDVRLWNGTAQNNLISGRVDASVGAMAADVVTATAIATDAIGSAELAASAITEIQAGLATSAALATVQADTDDIQTRLPAALVSGRMDSSVGAMAAGVVTAAAVATDAIDSDAIAASAVTEIQAGLATSAALATVQADTDDIQSRLPAALVGGRMDSSVGAMAAGVVTAAAIATDAIDADALAASALAEINAEVDTALADIRLDELIQNAASPSDPTADSFIDLMTSKDAGQTFDRSTDSLEAVRDALAAAGPSAAVIADAVWDEVLAGHLTAGSTGFALDAAAAGGAGLTAQQVRDAMKLAPTAGAPAAGSVDEHLDDILADTNVIEPLVSTNLDATISSRASAAALATVQADTDDIQGRLPATLSGGRMRSQVEGMDAGTVTAAAIATGAVDADALAADAGTEIAAAVDVTLTAAHGAGAWGGAGAPTVAQIADGVWDEVLAGHLTAGTTGAALNDAAAGGAGLTSQQVANALLLTPVGVPAAGSVYSEFDVLMGPGFNALTDSLEEIRDEVDACCGTGGGGPDEINVEGI